MPINLSEHEDAFQIVDGLPRPQWQVISRLLEPTPDAERNAAWSDIARQWLSRIQSIWKTYERHSSANFLLLTADSKSAGPLLTFSELALRHIRTMVFGSPTAGDEGYGPHVIIDCASAEHYYDYICYFDEDGDWATSGGMFVNDVYGHIILAPSKQRRETIAHELSHDLLRHLPLPRWVDEGIAMTMEEIVVHGDRGWPMLEFLEQLRDFWPAYGIDRFWHGDSFRDPHEDTQHFSYATARCLVRRLAEDYPRSFHAFVNEAHWSDAGEQAAVKHFGCGLGEIIRGLLGDGDWTPTPIEPAGEPSDDRQ